MSAHLSRAGVLLEQSRFDMAETEARRALGEDPNSAHASAILALALSAQEKHKEATKAAQNAIAMEPDWDFTHYVMAVTLDARDRLQEAQTAIEEAIRLDPEDPDYFALLAGLHAQRNWWREALNAAEEGLAVDAEHVECTNFRAMALTKLGRKTDAAAAIEAALARAPEDSLTHANRGWTLLQTGEHKKALEHFREASRLDPENEWARQGILEAMKSRHLLYRVMMKYFFFMSRFSRRAQWILIIGAVLGIRLLRAAAHTYPPLEPFVIPIACLYIAFVILTWISDPLFNLLLRIDRFGRHVLSDDQRKGANLFGGCVLLAVTCLALTPWLGIVWGIAGLFVFGILILPCSAIFRCPAGWPRFVMAIYTFVVASFGVAGLIEVALAGLEQADRRLGVCFFGCILGTWIGAGLTSMRLRK